MGLFRKKSDPIKDRARALEEEIAALEAEIGRLDLQLARRNEADQPALALGDNSTATSGLRTGMSPAVQDPVFEEVDITALEGHGETAARPTHFNELGVRKYDLPALMTRLKNHLRGPATTNPKLVSYLAAGGIQGLRPMRYERRVARNRFIALVLLLLLIMLGIAAVFVRG